jgi:hypothetical protein
MLAGLVLGEPVAHAGLAVFPLNAASGSEGSGYLTLEQALEKELLVITEAEEAGRVNELTVANRAGEPVLLVDGEELIGAKQNRVFNLSMLIPALTTIDVPVSCVERGRWSYRSARFAASARAQHATGRARRQRAVTDSLRMRGSATGNQQDVWRDLDAKAQRLQAESATGAMSEMFERHSATVERFVKPLQVGPAQVGALFALSGSALGLEVFDSSATCARLLPKVLRGYALDALDYGRANEAPPSEDAARGFVERVGAGDWHEFPVVGAGVNLRLETPDLTGSALLEAERVLHLAAFALA